MTFPRRAAPSGTYRLQLHHEFTFADAAAQLPYLEALGVSHLYLSPITEAVPGSLHGYDVVDPSRINPELGGEDGLRALVEAVRAHGLGVVIDIVPNHMAASDRNPRWWDVLRHGRTSRFAHWFDIDWDARDSVAVPGKVIVPVLGDELEAVLGRRELSVDTTEAEPVLRYFDRRFPLTPETPLEDTSDVRGVLEAQHYVLSYWREAKAHLDYRRFFTIDELIGVRVEDDDVFAGTHALFGRLQHEGLIDGVRVDHADGLSDPATYFERLRALLGAEAYIVAEKILARGEALPANWPIEGTTGYDFMDAATGLLLDPRGVARLEADYAATTGRTTPFEELELEGRRRILDGALAGQFDRAARQLYRAVQPPPVEFAAFEAALSELLANMPRYRTYHAPDRLDPEAPAVIEVARTAALADSDAPVDAIDAVARVLAHPPEAARIAVMRLQQLMPAVQAKAVEDNAFYRYAPLLALCEVGSEPPHVTRTPEEFHREVAARAARWPASMLATATHDHKRGEDARARLDVLAELPDWRDFVAACAAAVDASSVAPLDAYTLYQTLVGVWTPPATNEARDDLADRVRAYVVKAAREAGEHTDWDAPDAAYEAALEAHATALIAALAAGAIPVASTFLERVARLGRSNSLAQLVLRLTIPGVPDTYQGTEAWDLSLVDPDNRRPVDYIERAARLEALAPLLEDSAAGIDARRARLPALWPAAEDATVKPYVLARLLRLRRAWHPFGVEASYLPLEVRGPHANHALAFAREHEGRWLVVAVTRLPAGLEASAAPWHGTDLVLPPGLDAPLRDVLAGTLVTPTSRDGGAILPLREAFATLPVAVLTPEDAR